MTTIKTFEFSADLLRVLLWTYDGSTPLRSLLQSKKEWYDLYNSKFWTDWVRDVFDLRTANEFGCNVWSIILGIPLQVTLAPSPPSKPTWGFGEFNQNFGNGNFSRDADQSARLTLAQKRLVLRLRYFQLISRGTVPETNQFLKLLFGEEGDVYVLDRLDMTYAIFVFTFQPSSQLAFILEEYDLLPRPAAIGAQYIVVTRKVFGFGDYNLNFNNGNFLS